MSHRLYRASAALLVAAMLAGCGGQAVGLASSINPAVQRAIAAASVEPIDVDALLVRFKAIEGFEAPQMEQRYGLVAQLGDSDDDRAFAFLQAEYENLVAYPEAVRPAYQARLAEALDALDTYDAALDEPIIAAGAGDTAIEAAAYRDAMARKKRKKSLMDWLASPFRWVGDKTKQLWDAIRGKKKRKKRRKPRPAPVDPAPLPADM